MRINKFLQQKLTRCCFRDSDCIKYDWRFGQKADPEALREWFRTRPCDSCVYGITVFTKKPLPTWEYVTRGVDLSVLTRRPVILRPDLVQNRLGYFDVFYQMAVPTGGVGMYTDDLEDTILVSFPLCPMAEPWSIQKKDLAGLADRVTLIYFAKYYKELHRGEFREHFINICQQILELGGDVDCLFR